MLSIERAGPGPGAAPSEPRRPRVATLGRLPAPLALDRLALDVELEPLRAAKDLVLSGGAGTPDLVLLEGTLPEDVLGPLLHAAGPPGRVGRPAVIVVTDEGRRTHVAAELIDHVDDFVNGALGAEVLLARMRVALRMREYLAELERKNAELAELSGRLEGLATRMADELRLAASVQRSLLPVPLQHPRLEVAREFIPVREIGGDYLDIVTLGPDRIALAVGDVMGKGVPAALLAANLKACLRGQLQSGTAAVEDVVARVNRLFWEISPQSLFASLFFGVFDLERGHLEYVNAGHDHPFHVGARGVDDLCAGGTVLGLMESSEYERGCVELEPGDLVVFYSDGVTDRANADAEVYGVERLKRAALRTRRDPARIALYTMLGDVQEWALGETAEDDVTLVVARLR